MAKFLMVKEGTLEPMGYYEADAVDQSRISSDQTILHVEIPSQVEPRFAKAIMQNGQLTVVSSRTYSATAIEREEFGAKLIREFMAGNQAGGISAAASYQVLVAMLPIVVCLRIGALESALYAIKGIPQEARDGVYVSDAKLLAYCNAIESFLGISLSTSV